MFCFVSFRLFIVVPKPKNHGAEKDSSSEIKVNLLENL